VHSPTLAFYLRRNNPHCRSRLIQKSQILGSNPTCERCPISEVEVNFEALAKLVTHGGMAEMKIAMRKKILGVGSAAVLTMGLAFAVPASAAPATSQTFHFSSVVGWNTAINPVNPGSCPDWAVNDNVFMNMTGNGVQHVTYNAAGDSWFTTTFTGSGTIAFYGPNPVNYTYSDPPNNTIISGLSDPSLQPEMTLTGHLTQWFGFESNNKNAVGHGTVEFKGTDNGTGIPFTLHFHQQAVWAVGANPNTDPPKLLISLTSC
jgi:hypothetical protein